MKRTIEKKEPNSSFLQYSKDNSFGLSKEHLQYSKDNSLSLLNELLQILPKEINNKGRKKSKIRLELESKYKHFIRNDQIALLGFKKKLNLQNLKSLDKIIHHQIQIKEQKRLYTIKAKEKINKHKLNLIIHNYHNIFTDDIKQSNLSTLKTYLQNINQNNTIETKYFQNFTDFKYGPLGRQFAYPSIQNMKSIIKNTICDGKYTDLDIQNCHPTLLLHLCNILHIKTPFLLQYVQDRPQILEQFKNKITAKRLYLEMMNGKYNNTSFDIKKYQFNSHLYGFIQEMKRIHPIISKRLPQYGLKTFELKRNSKKHNLFPSYVNQILCDMENKIIITIYQFFGKPEICTLMFDGIMFYNKNISQHQITSCQNHIHQKFNIKIKLKIKPMNNIIDTSNLKIKNKNTNDIYQEYKLITKNIPIPIGNDGFPFLNKQFYLECIDSQHQSTRFKTLLGLALKRNDINNYQKWRKWANLPNHKSIWDSLIVNKTSGYNIGTVIKLAKQSNPTLNQYLSPNNIIKQLFTSPFKEHQIYSHLKTYDQKYVLHFPKFNIRKHKTTFLIKSRLGSGKSTQIINSILRQLEKNHTIRILVLSPRKTFAYSICGDLNKAHLDFECYLETKDLNQTQKLVCQMESLFKLQRDYDILIADEIVSCLTQLSSRTTMKNNIQQVVEHFQRIYNNSKLAILADAFIDPKTHQFVKDMGLLTHRKLYYTNNINKPEKRTAVQYHSKTTPEKKIIPALQILTEHLFNQLKLGKKCAFFCASKQSALKIKEAYLLDTQLPNDQLKIYTSASDSEDLKNVNESWYGKSLVIFTSTITVGVSFSRHWFDLLYCYSSCMSSLVRDVFQGLKRARHIKDKTLHFALWDNHFGSGAYLQTTFSDVKKHITDKIHSDNNLVTEINHLHPDENVQRFQNAPNWFINVHCYNILEKNLNILYHQQIFKKYLELNNYTIRNSQSTSDLFEPDQNAPITFSYENLDVKDFYQLNVQQKLNNKESLTVHERFLKYKYDFENMIKKNVPVETKKDIFNKYFCNGNQGIRKFFNLKREKNNNVTLLFNKNVNDNVYNVLSQNISDQLLEINKFKSILQINKTTEHKIFQKQFINQISDQIIDNKDKWYKLFKIRDRAKSKLNDKTHIATIIIKNIITNWCGYTFKMSEKQKQIRVNGKKIDISDYHLKSQIKEKPHLDVIETML